jgi:hypothetical protein
LENISHIRQDFSFHRKIPDMSKSKSAISKQYAEGWDLRSATLSDFADTITSHCWSPVVFRNGVRKSSNFFLSSLVALDFDSPEYTLRDALNDWCDTIHVIGTTVSHQKDKNGITCDRFRIVSVWDKPIIKASNYKPNMNKLIESNMAFHADKSCVDLGRYFLPCKAIVSINAEGYKIQTKEYEEIIYEDTVEEIGDLSQFAVDYLHTKFPEGKRNTNTWRFAKDLFKAGYNQNDVIKIIINAPTYKGVIDEYIKEIVSTVKSARKNFLTNK